LIAHALEIGIDLDDTQDQPEITREWSLAREQSQAEIIDLNMRLVDQFLVFENLHENRRISLQNGAYRSLNCDFDMSAHLQDQGL
jgi:hypothetical protein